METTIGKDQGRPFRALRVEGRGVCLAGEEGWEVVFAGEGEGGA